MTKTIANQKIILYFLVHSLIAIFIFKQIRTDRLNMRPSTNRYFSKPKDFDEKKNLNNKKTCSGTQLLAFALMPERTNENINKS